MKLHATGSDRLVGREGGGCLALFGLPFLLAGLFVTSAAIAGEIPDSDTGEPAPRYFTVPFGMIFVTVGAVLVFGRRGIVIDRLSNQFTVWYGLMVPMHTKRQPLGEADEIRVTKEVRRSKNSTYTVYPVRLCGGTKPFDISEPRQYQQSRQLAEQIAKFLTLPMVDQSGGTTVRREADQLDESLRDQVIRTGQVVPWPEPPADMRSSYEVRGDTLLLEVPPVGVTPSTWISIAGGLLPGVVISTFMWVAGFFEFGGDDPMAMTFIGVFVLILFVLPLAGALSGALHKARLRVNIVASPRELRITSAGLRKRERAIPTDELEELEVKHGKKNLPGVLAMLGGGNTLLARSDREDVSTTLNVSHDELDWIHGAIRYVVTGRE